MSKIKNNSIAYKNKIPNKYKMKNRPNFKLSF